MKLNEFKKALSTLEILQFITPTGHIVPAHFHVTEIGKVNKQFIDCGGQYREEQVVRFQLWTADDHDHRLAASKLTKIISLGEEKLGLGDWEIEVEYQGQTIGKYGLDFDGISFHLVNTITACLASDACGIPSQKQKIELQDLTTATANTSCKPGGGCC